jgi:sugar transferase (PEP-CTERM/EpsH1 system associated)
VHEWRTTAGGQPSWDRRSILAKILFLAHRVPFPPNKGDKIRAFHLLQHLGANHQVWLGAGADDPSDRVQISTADLPCREVCIVPLGPVRRAINMATAAATGAPLSVSRFRHPRLERWIARVMREVRPEIVFVYSSAPAQYVIGRMPPDCRLIVDFVDADAEKWRAYAEAVRPPIRWVYEAEYRRLVRFDRRALSHAAAALFVSPTERALFARLSGVDGAKLQVIANGVDTEYFRPTVEPPDSGTIVLCGRMDYRPNIDAARWFALEILPKVRAKRPDAVFRIVGADPAAQVLALNRLPGVEVLGGVPDVRPFVARAAVVVAPLRIARGVQNKVLEGMACGRPVVATPAAIDGIDAVAGQDVLVAASTDGFAEAVSNVLANAAPADLGARARQYAVNRHQWASQLQALDQLIASLLGDAVRPGSGLATAILRSPAAAEGAAMHE